MFYAGDSRADMHVHSKYSDRPSEWFLRRLGAPECFVEPLEIYRAARERGMDFVTITDHNCIRGALEIAHLPGVFVSAEVTTYFPENGCKIHCLAWDVTEAQFAMIQELRASIFELHKYLNEEDICHAIAHPLFRINDRLTQDQLECLMLMFKRFEAINGTREARSAAITQTVFDHLTPELIDQMADRQGIEPTGPDPWIKYFTGGSDDHSGTYTASAHTVVPHAESVEEFLAHIRRGDHQAAGSPGGSLHLAHCLYKIAYGYYKSRFLGQSDGKPNLIEILLRKLIGEERPPAPKPASGLTGIVTGFLTEYIRSRHLRQLGSTERMLVEELADLFSHQLQNESVSPPKQDRATFRLACHISHTLGYRLLGKIQQQIEEGRLLDGLQTFAALGPAALSVAPYLASFATQHKDDGFLDSVCERFVPTDSPTRRPQRKAWITDTFGDINGVCRTIQTVASLAKKTGKRLTVLTCLDTVPECRCDVKNFKPVGMFALPEYEDQQIAFPPFLEIIEYLERHEITEVIVSTPGPMGLTALAAARLLGLKTTGIYHTDFPQYVRYLTDDHNLEHLTWRYMHWFYDQCHQVLAPSEYYRKVLVNHGIEPQKVSVLIRGVDLDRFGPSRRDPTIWDRWNLASDRFKFLYVGRISADKNVRRLLEAFTHLQKQGHDADLVLIGDGPQRAELAREFRHPQIRFTGYLEGDALAAAYASGDAMVFPSTTDTFGNVVLEAQASGLPVIVSNQGGPAEIVGKHESGIVVDVDAPERLSESMIWLLTDTDFQAKLRDRGLANAARHTWQNVLDQLWRGNSNDKPSPRLLAKAT